MCAEALEGYSGSDISAVATEAMLYPVRELFEAKFFQQVEHNGKLVWTPCSPMSSGATEINLNDLKDGDAIPRPVMIVFE